MKSVEMQYIGLNYGTMNDATTGENSRFMKCVVAYSVMGDLTVTLMSTILAPPC